MSMSVDPEFRKRLIAGALQSVEVAAKARGWFNRFGEGHRHKTEEFDQISAELLEDSIRTAMHYGYPGEAARVGPGLGTML